MAAGTLLVHNAAQRCAVVTLLFEKTPRTGWPAGGTEKDMKRITSLRAILTFALRGRHTALLALPLLQVGIFAGVMP